jgi:bifunctional non-homologous end joining protein LigD
MKSSARALPAKREVVIEGVRITNPDRVVYPKEGITKEALALYYAAIAPRMMPHAANRVLTLVRCPGGEGKGCFYQKHAIEGFEALRRVPIREEDGVADYLAIESVEGLITLIQMGTLEIHTWGSRADKPELPDKLIFDLDPDPAVPWPRVIDAARRVRAIFETLGLEPFVMTTGGKGLHVVTPIRRGPRWPEIRAFAQSIAEGMASEAPDRYVANMSKAKRRGKIFIDYLRNARGATAIAPYSTRARPGATVAMPIRWEDLKPSLTADAFTIRGLERRLRRSPPDPWAGYERARRSITGVLSRLRITRR